MTTHFLRLIAALGVLTSLLAVAGCHSPQGPSASAPATPVTPQQQQVEIDGNSHIPPAQKAEIERQLSQKQAQQTTTGSH